jgi:adenosylcobinamide kinase/adenosylcobinamide-phosphate guanylyltransferase
LIVLVGGGSRSGKSRFALDYARRCGEPRAFVATAETLDDEMRARARVHQAEREGAFTTMEEPLEITRAINEAGSRYRVIVVDCLTVWLSNLMHTSRDISIEGARVLLAGLESPSTVVLVTNEVGCGIVPENELSRHFRDEAGRLNQRAAAAASEVYWMVFGLSQRLK